MIPYLLMLAAATWLARKVERVKDTDAKRANRLKWLLIVFLVCFIGFRHAVGADYFAYIHDFNMWSNLSYGEILVAKEPLIRLLAKLCNIVSSTPTPFFLAMAAIFIAPAVCTIYKYSSSFALSIILFILCGSYLDCCNASRQCMAAGIIFANYDNLIHRRMKQYLLFVGIASLFHSSAITMLPLYFIFSPHATLKQQMLWIGAAASLMLVSYYTLMSATEDILGKELDSKVAYFNTTVNIFRILVYVAPCSFLFLMRKTGQRLASYSVFIIFNAILALVTWRSAYLMRVCIFTNIFLSLALPDAIANLATSRDTVKNVRNIMLGSYFFYWIYGILNSAGLYPYQTIFTN